MNITQKIAYTLILTGLLTACGSSIETEDSNTTETETSTQTTTSTSITHNGTIYGFVTSPHTGKVWLDRNLGAARVCESFNDTACYGDYYQWGRNFDGHEDSTSANTRTQATDVNAAGSAFIINSSDWASVDAAGTTRTANWLKTDGSSVCPVGYRVPTLAELRADTLEKVVTDRNTAYSSFLKLPSSGCRYNYSASMGDVGLEGFVWTSSVNGSSVSFGIGSASSGGSVRTNGFTVRCLRD